MTKHVGVILVLWLIAIATTLLEVGAAPFTHLGPVFFICMLGSIVTVRRAAGTKTVTSS
jgi:hypothetical protein